MKDQEKQAEASDRARVFIDSVAAINKRYGMSGQIPKDRYDRAVADASRIYRKVRST